MRPQSTRKETERKLGAHSQCGPGEARHIGTEVQEFEGSESESEEGDRQARARRAARTRGGGGQR